MIELVEEAEVSVEPWSSHAASPVLEDDAETIDLESLTDGSVDLHEVLMRIRRCGVIDLDAPIREVLAAVNATEAVEPQSILVGNNRHYCFVVKSVDK